MKTTDRMNGGVNGFCDEQRENLKIKDTGVRVSPAILTIRRAFSSQSFSPDHSLHYQQPQRDYSSLIKLLIIAVIISSKAQEMD